MKKNYKHLEKHTSDIFLIIVFIYMALRIYVDAYLHNTMMSPDSCGYMREAINLAHGNGFRCDGIAGYNTWFANWPIMYPLIIACAMIVTKANAYLASKIVSIVIVGVILLIFRQRYKENAWIYSICVLNLGFINLAEYTWSECTFILFLLGFTFVLAKIISEEHVKSSWYIGLGVLGCCTFLSRYIGLYVWFVVGIYLLYMLLRYVKDKEKDILHKIIGLTVTAGVSGVLGLAYLAMNKKMNGMASGVNRGANPNEDYLQLTKDLANSLLTEVFNVFGIGVSPIVVNIMYVFKFVILLAIVICLVKYAKKRCKWTSSAGVICMTGAVYYLVIIIFRYFSYMDTFSSRFFEPATFIICVGLLEMIVPEIRDKSGYVIIRRFVMLSLACAAITMCMSGFTETENSYNTNVEEYETLYSEVPEKSTIIIRDDSEYDYWLTAFRPDTVQGYATTCTSVEEIYNRFGKSNYVCISVEVANEMLNSESCSDDLKTWIQSELQREGSRKFVVLSLVQE